jgi:lipopolysaccharide export system protein LptC
MSDGASPAYARARLHSARVKKLKILLPALALLISAGFIAVSFLSNLIPGNLQFDGATIEDGKIVMQKPAMSGRNAEGTFYSMTAKRALQDVKSPNLITLESIEAVVPANNDLTAKVIATSGIFDRDTDRMNMTAPFKLLLSNGITANFQSAFLDTRAGEMTSDEPITISTPNASVVANSLQIEDKGSTVIFEGGVKVVIDPKALRDEGR